MIMSLLEIIKLGSASVLLVAEILYNIFTLYVRLSKVGIVIYGIVLYTAFRKFNIRGKFSVIRCCT